MTAALVERLAPEDLWELFQRVVPSAPVRPQGGGHRRRGDREVLAAIIFVATSGCTWNQLPPGFGLSGVTAFRRFTEWTEARVWAKLHRLVLDELGSQGGVDWSRCAIDSVSARALKGAADGTESDRPRQEGFENPPER
jgi:transposase